LASVTNTTFTSLNFTVDGAASKEYEVKFGGVP
jgi:hypothetical protein